MRLGALAGRALLGWPLLAPPLCAPGPCVCLFSCCLSRSGQATLAPIHFSQRNRHHHPPTHHPRSSHQPCHPSTPPPNRLYRIQTPQTPIARTRQYDRYCMDEFPAGTNAGASRPFPRPSTGGAGLLPVWGAGLLPVWGGGLLPSRPAARHSQNHTCANHKTTTRSNQNHQPNHIKHRTNTNINIIIKQSSPCSRTPATTWRTR